MKPQKKAIIAKKATKPSLVVKKRRMLIETAAMDAKKDKKIKKLEKVEEVKKKFETEKKKLDEKKVPEEKKKIEERRKEKIEKTDDKKKPIKDSEKKTEKVIEKKTEDKNEDEVPESVEKKKGQKSDGKVQIEKTLSDPKRKLDKVEERTKIKTDEEPQEKINDNDEIDLTDNKASCAKKKIEKKKELKLPKPESKENSKIIKELPKEKKIERKKTTDLDSTGKLSPGRKKDPKVKPSKKTGPKKTVLAKKGNPSVATRFLEKKLKLVKCFQADESLTEVNNEAVTKIKKKPLIPKNKPVVEKKLILDKQMKAKLPPKKLILRKEEKARNLEKAKKRAETKDLEKASDIKKPANEEVDLNINTSEIKKEVIDEKEVEKAKEVEKVKEVKEEPKKILKNVSKAKVPKKTYKKASKVSKDKHEDPDKEESGEEDSKEVAKAATNTKDHPESLMKVDLKVEDANCETSGSSTASDSSDESWRNGRGRSSKRKERKDRKERTRTPSDERARRMRLFGFWSGPKRHRVASLNALAKVHCLYENEAGGVYLGGFCKPKPEKEKLKEKKAKEEKDKEKEKEKEREKEAVIKKEKDKQEKIKNEQETAPKRKLRNVPGLRGKHWDMHESVSSSSSSSEEECVSVKSEKVKKTIVKRKKKVAEVMDLKDMVVCKRMASLNASAILAASYSDEKIRLGSDSDSSSESEVEIIKRKRHVETDAEKQKRLGSEPEEVIKPSKKVVIVNQDTDVTITGVYVNQTRSTHHEGFCSIAGMQYRISSTSHTQTAATAVATELHDQQKPEQPCKSYTPLGALSSMQPPGSQGNRSSMSPRRHSAFSAPHQHGYYQPAGPLIQHPPTLPPVKAPPPEPTPTPPQNSEGSDDLVPTSASSGTSGGPGFYRAYCPQYYGTPPQYQDLCYPPTYAHPHPHPPPYYKYPPTYRRQYYGYQESGGGGGPGGGAGAGPGPGPGVVDYQPPPPPGEYPLPPYYAGYPPVPPPPPPNPAYLHAQGRPFVDHAAFQSCPCPMQSCPKNVDTGPLIGNGKGAPVASGPGLSLPPSALVGPPSPARGLAGLAPPHGANAWDTDRVQLNPLRNLSQNQPSLPTSHNHVGNLTNRPQNSECRTKDEKSCAENKMRKCSCQKKQACTSTCEVKIESISPVENLSTTSCPSSKIHNFKLENNNVKCESCSVEIGENLTCAANCNVKCESGYKCEILKCEQCDKEGEMAIMDMDKDSGILLIDDKLETDTEVKEELNDVVVIDGGNWKKADYEPTVRENVEEKEPSERMLSVEEEPKCQKLTKRKLSLDSLSDSRKKRKVNKRTLSVGSTRELVINEQSSDTPPQAENLMSEVDGASESCTLKKKQTKKEPQNPKRKAECSNPSEAPTKKPKTKPTSAGALPNSLKSVASDTSIMETINNVIQQSVQMTEKKDKKTKNVDRVAEKNNKNANLMSTIKKVTRKLELNSVVEKTQSKGKVEVKPKPKIQDAKCKSKVKAKFIEVKSKILDIKLKVHVPKTRETCKKIEYLPKLRSGEIIEDKKSVLAKKKRKSTKKTLVKKMGGKVEDNVIVNEHLTVARKPFLKPKWSNGWSWEGDAYEAKVYLTNEESAIRRCYDSMRHVSGDILRSRDCVLLRSGPRKADLPFVAKIAALWENPDDGEMMFSLLWYYRPEHTEQGRTEFDTEDEVFASRHRDANSVACIEDKCYILTFSEYCRYRKNIRRLEEGVETPCLIVPPGDQVYPRKSRQPPLPVPADMVLFCRRVYDYRGKKLVKNPG